MTEDGNLCLHDLGYTSCEHPRRIYYAYGDRVEMICADCRAKWNDVDNKWQGGSLYSVREVRK